MLAKFGGLFIGIFLFAAFVVSWQKGSAEEKQGLVWGYINTAGKYIVQPKFDEANTVYDGLGLIKLNGLYGYVDKTGKIAITPQFQNACDFLAGRAQVEKGGKWGFINPSGKFIVQPTKSEFTPPLCTQLPPSFPNGLEPVKVGKKWGFKNTKGKVVIPAQYEQVAAFGDGLAPVAVPINNVTR